MPIPGDDSPPVRLAIIGAGGAVRAIHVPTLQRLTGQFTVTAICSRNLDLAQSVAAMVGAPVASTDVDAVLARDDVDAALIAVPIHLSARIIRRALEADKHVLAEKPLAANVAEARELVDLSRRNPGRVAMVGANMRYAAHTAALKEAIWDASIGKPETAYHHSIGHIDPATQGTWRARPQYRGGYLLDGGIHVAATLRTLFGNPTRVAAVDEIHAEPLGGKTGLTMHFRTDRDVQVIGTFLVTTCPSAVPSAVLNVYGTKGSVCVSSVDGQIRTSVAGSPPSSRPVPYDFGHIAQLQDFFRAIRTGEPPLSSFEEGLLDMLLIDRALDSAAPAISPSNPRQ